MKKRILTLLLSVAMLFSSLPLQTFAAEDKGIEKLFIKKAFMLSKEKKIKYSSI